MSVKSKGSRRTWRDPDDAPEITGKWIAEADLYRGKKLVRRGRPAGSGQKTQTTLRISKDVLEFFRATGPGWQTRMDNALKRYVASQRR
ncbi:MAG: BrnA antitoxin family protein [Steroidobacteraceae bacterium]